ncbi:isoleucine--tRNA ligase [Sulfurospirillum arcachonense]|uniref:isoleucine--tRNA ligase n=1 Tax=Sulfurospirillum arcachonense TaxID=57666 RepID=UPI000468F26D|nr:isoleucine--tRNA ligase [Sulfurospirillum arcachonense]
MDYKDTLLLPKTGFSMRGNLPQNEPKRYTQWFNEDKAYEKMKTNRKNAEKKFILHDGPPYANGHIHIGHALNKILKDIIVKTHYFFGEEVRYVPGWDCHGLPIEQQVEKKIGKEKKESLPKSKIRELCREHARKFIDIQRDEFKALGVIGDWKNPYMTMKFEFEADIYRALCEVATKGLLIERSKPVYWSWAARTALAEAEVEYEDKEDYSIYVAYPLKDEAKKALEIEEDANVIIWTTTPWTLPANMAISFNPEEDYVLTTDGFIVAKALHESLLEQEVLKGEIKKTFKADILENLYAKSPLNGKDSKLILGEHVTMDGGSGCVHTAPGHGEEDYRVGLKYNIEVMMPVDERGCYDETVVREGLLPDPESFVNVHIFKANERILELLGDSLLKCSKFTHSYPFCWRTHKPVIYRATKQWFIAMDEETKGRDTLRQMATQNISKVKFYPESGINRLGSMIENRPDWCISRQRDWGVPIAFFRDKTTGEPIFDEKVMNYTAMIFEQRGADAWWDMEISELLYPGSGYNPENLEKVMDILDVWFDSGSTWKAVLESRVYDSGAYPASMYLEGSDQHRGWFQSSLLVSTAARGIAPYDKVLTHGFTVDAKGEKMSKSKGNVVAPNDIAKQYGVEILRLWVSLSEYTTDLKISNEILKQVSEQYRKIRNTCRFLLANSEGLKEILPYEKMGVLDRWILNHAKKVFDEVEACFKEYDFSKGFSLLSHFIAVELSGIYLDISKDRLYCNGEKENIRLSTQSATALITRRLLALIAPTLTYTVDEILEHAPAIIKEDMDDVFDMLYTQMDNIEVDFDAEYMMEAREKFFEIIDNLKKEKVIKSTLELVLVTTSEKVAKINSTDAEDWFTTSGIVSESTGEDMGSFKVGDDTFKIVKATENKCPRCWKFKSSEEEGLCKRCDEVLNA